MTTSMTLRQPTTRRLLALGALCSACALAGVVATDAPSAMRGSPDTTLDEPSLRHRTMADCLWPAARDHGFYAVQEDALATDAAPDARAVWKAFLESIGAERCGYEPIDLAPLTTALRDTREAAAAHFTAAR